jgi:hypothetical protein
MNRINWSTVVVSVVVSLVVTGGVATAADTLIGTRDIKRGAVTLTRLSPGVQKILRIRAVDGENGEVGESGATGATGVTGLTGANGATGIAGTPGANGLNGATGETGAPGLDADGNRVVNGSSLYGFVLAPDGDNTPAYGGGDNDGAHGTYSFDTAPTTPVAPHGATSLLGSKALHVAQSVNGKSMAVFLPFKKTQLSELTDLSYSTIVTNRTSNAAEDISMQIEVLGSSSTAFGNGYGTLVYEPSFNGAPTSGWHRNNAISGKWWFTKASTTPNPSDCSINNPCKLSTFLDENPSSTILSVKLRNGQNNGGAGPGFEAWVDNVTLGYGTATNFDLGG